MKARKLIYISISVICAACIIIGIFTQVKKSFCHFLNKSKHPRIFAQQQRYEGAYCFIYRFFLTYRIFYTR